MQENQNDLKVVSPNLEEWEQYKTVEKLKLAFLGLNFVSSIIVILLLVALTNKATQMMFYFLGRSGY